MDDFEPSEYEENNSSSPSLGEAADTYNNAKDLGAKAGQKFTKDNVKSAGTDAAKKASSDAVKNAGESAVGSAAGSATGGASKYKEDMERAASGDANEKIKATRSAGLKAAGSAAGAYFGGPGGKEAGEKVGEAVSKTADKVDDVLDETTGTDTKTRTAIGCAMPFLLTFTIVMTPIILLIFLAGSLFMGSEDEFKDLYTIVTEEQQNSNGIKLPLKVKDQETEEISVEQMTPVMFMREGEIKSIVTKYNLQLSDDQSGDYDDFMPTEDGTTDNEGVLSDDSAYELKGKVLKTYLLSEYVNFGQVEWYVRTGPTEYDVNKVTDMKEIGGNWLENLFQKRAKIPDPDTYHTMELTESSEDEQREAMLQAYYNLLSPYLQNWMVPYSLNIVTQDNAFGNDVLRNMNADISVELLEYIEIEVETTTSYSLESDITVLVKEKEMGYVDGYYDHLEDEYGNKLYKLVRYKYEGENWSSDDNKMEPNNYYKIEEGLLDGYTYKEVVSSDLTDYNISSSLDVYDEDDYMYDITVEVESVELHQDSYGNYIAIDEKDKKVVETETPSYIPAIKEAVGFYSILKNEYTVVPPDKNGVPDAEDETPLSSDGDIINTKFYRSKVGITDTEETKYKIASVREDEYADLGREISRIEWIMDHGEAGSENPRVPEKTSDELAVTKFKYNTIPNLSEEQKTSLNYMYQNDYYDKLEKVEDVWSESQIAKFTKILGTVPYDVMFKIFKSNKSVEECVREYVADAIYYNDPAELQKEVDKVLDGYKKVASLSEIQQYVQKDLQKIGSKGILGIGERRFNDALNIFQMYIAYNQIIDEEILSEEEQLILDYLLQGEDDEISDELKLEIKKVYAEKNQDANDEEEDPDILYLDFDRERELGVYGYTYKEDLSIGFEYIEEYYNKLLNDPVVGLFGSMINVPLSMPDPTGMSWPVPSVLGTGTSIDDVIKNGFSSPDHPRIDIISKGVESVVVEAAASGTVISAGYDSRSGNYVMIEHDNDFYTIYKYLASTNKSIGNTVSKGEMIGVMGTLGSQEMLGFEVVKSSSGVPSLNGSDGRKDPSMYYNDNGTPAMYVSGEFSEDIAGMIELAIAAARGGNGTWLYGQNNSKYPNPRDVYGQTQRDTGIYLDTVAKFSSTDCSAFVSSMYNQFLGVSTGGASGSMKTNANNGNVSNGYQAAIARFYGDISVLMPGDILWKSGHVGLYVGDGYQVDHGYGPGPHYRTKNVTAYTHYIRYIKIE